MRQLKTLFLILAFLVFKLYIRQTEFLQTDRKIIVTEEIVNKFWRFSCNIVMSKNKIQWSKLLGKSCKRQVALNLNVLMLTQARTLVAQESIGTFADELYEIRIYYARYLKHLEISLALLRDPIPALIAGEVLNKPENTAYRSYKIFSTSIYLGDITKVFESIRHDVHRNHL